MTVKKNLGQFFTTNSHLILNGFEKEVVGKNVIDPFAGGGDLLNWAQTNVANSVKGYDIDTNLVDNKRIFLNDSLLAIPGNKTDMLITNPPYLANNKQDAIQKEKYGKDVYDDLYLLAMKRLLTADCNEGIIIVPVNFFSAENSDLLRQEFLSVYRITKVNYFKFQVFEDTTYNVVAFHYVKKTFIASNECQTFDIRIYSSYDSLPEVVSFTVEKEFKYRIAGRALADIINTKPLKIRRLTDEFIKKNKGSFVIETFFNDKGKEKNYNVNLDTFNLINNNIILLNCIDTNGSEDGWINAEDIRTLGKQALIGKVSSRNNASISFIDGISIEKQEKAIKLFNSTLNSLRKEYRSLFLTNFRDNDRKRVSFEFCYKLITYCLSKV